MPVSDSITLPVDAANNGTITNATLSLFEGVPGRKEFHFSGHSFTAKDQLVLTRSLPKVNGNFPGTRKSSMKFTKEFVVDGVDPTTDIKVPAILEVSTSLPVGVTSVQALEIRQRAIALLDHAVAELVQDKCEI